MFRLAVVQCRTFQRRGNDVPTGPSPADVVNGHELARDGEGFAVGGGQGGGNSDVAGVHSQGGQQGQRLKAVQKNGVRLFADVKAVAKEDEIQLGLFRFSSQIAVVLQVDGAVGYGLGVPPGSHVAAGAGKEGAQPQLASFGRGFVHSGLAAVSRLSGAVLAAVPIITSASSL